MSLSKVGELKRLHAMGLGVHLLRPNSKVPLKPGWTDNKREPIKTLLKEYKTGMNIGTKLGEPSKIEDCYLAVIDVDIKGTDKRFRKEAEEWIEKHFPGLLGSAPVTHSGRGNGSKHIWCLVQDPMDSRKLTSSSELIEVHMPSVKPSKNDIEKLGKKKTDKGIRTRPAWELDFMCAGRQVVLPPSIHPDTGKAYRWGRVLEDTEQLSIITRSTLENISSSKAKGRPNGSSSKTKFEIEDVEEMQLEMKLRPSLMEGIYDGEGVEDRSSFCLSVALSMVKAKFTDAQILGVLTNNDFFIGSVAFEHAKTSNRQRAARWAYDYCVRKARQEADAAHVFDCEVEVYETLPEEKKKKQLKRVITDLGQVDWRKKLDRTQHDSVKPTAKNVVLILENAVGKNLIKYDEFSHSFFFGCENPWGSEVGKKIQDIDYINCRLWFAHSGFKIEPVLKEIGNAFRAIGARNSFHAVKEHLECLPAWDGVPRLSTWMKRLLNAIAPEPYLSEVSRKFLISAIARIYEPGCKVDTTVIFEGMQGLGKSTIGKILATDKWFLDQLPDLHDKDASQILQGNWFIELGELSSLKRSDVDTVKSYLTRTVDKFRPPYGENPVEFSRQCVFFGTTNTYEYLKDKSGNRRFLPIKVSEIDLDGLKAEREQLLAEAFLAYDLGEKHYFTQGSEAEKQSKDMQGSRVIEDESDVMYSILKGWWKQVIKSREKKAKEGQKLSKLSFKLEDLFGEFLSTDFGEEIKPPLFEFSKHPYKFQHASNALRRLGLENYPSNGRMKWRYNGKV